jgi:drug/metabolite transporter (DMT)-like permease
MSYYVINSAYEYSLGGGSLEYIEPNLYFQYELQHNEPGSGIRPALITKKRFDHFKGLSMVLLGAILWGVSGTAAQVLFQRDGFDPGWLVSTRMSASGLLLLLAVAIRSGLKPVFLVWRNTKDSLRLVLFGILGLLGVQYSYFASIQYGNAATATLLQYLGPVFITVYLAFRRRSLPNQWESIAVALALIGTFFLVTNGKWHGLSISTLAVVWGIISALTLSFYTLYPKGLLQTYGSATIVGWAMVIGGIGMAFKSPPWRFTGHSSLGAWWLVGFVVLFGTLVAFYLYISSLKYISASEASLLACGEPLSAAIVAMVFLHVKMGGFALFGGLCILVTVVILARKSST